MPTLLGLAFKAHLFHPKPACVASSLPAALVFSEQADKPVILLGLCSRRCLCLECPPSFLSSPATPPRSPAPSSGSRPGLLSGGRHFCSVLPQPLWTPASLLFYNFHHCVVKAGCMGQFSAPDAEKWRDWAGVGRPREHGQEAAAGFRWEVITWTMVGQWRWRQDTREIFRDWLME